MRSNPERGFRHELDDLCDAEPPMAPGRLSRLHECGPNNLTLAQTYCYLDPDETIEEDGPRVAMLEAGFAKLRQAGKPPYFLDILQAVLRFEVRRL